jgi:hypothetical protein
MAKRRLLAISVVVLLVAIARFLAPPALLRAKDRSAVDPGDGLMVIMNPIRDRSPENAAERVLRDLRAGRCETALGFLQPTRRADNCERERKYRITTWKLRDRTDKSEESRLFFAVFRGLSPIPSNMWITVRKSDGGWQPIDFECWY